MSISKKLYLLKSKTVRWLGIYLPVAGVVVEQAKEHLPMLAGYIPDGIYKGIMIACVVGIFLRASTTKALAEYKDGQ